MTGGFFAVLVIGILALNALTAMNIRDVKRLADMRIAQAAFESLFARSGSYGAAATGCGMVGNPVADCEFPPYGKTLAAVRDPGRYSYRVVAVPTAVSYGISFVLERDHQSIRKGRHVLTEAGIQ